MTIVIKFEDQLASTVEKKENYIWNEQFEL